MGYGKDVYELAAANLSERRSKANRDARIRRELVREKCPRALTIEAEVSKAGLQAARVILAGGADVAAKIEDLKYENLKKQREFDSAMREAGFPPDFMEPRYFCAKCRDEGYIDGMMCACMKQALKEAAYEKLNRLSPLGISSFEGFDLQFYSAEPDARTGIIPRRKMETIYEACKEYAAHFSAQSPSLLMIGATGLGKTHLSLAIAGDVLARGFGVVYGSAQNLTSKLEREHFGRAPEGEESAALLLECDLLILDDLGTEFVTPFVASCIYNLINTRLMAGRPTIVNTNLSIAELEEKYSERVVSRMMGSYRVFTFLGRDIRQLKRMRAMQS